MDVEQAREAVAFAGRVLGAEGVTRGPVGHVSLRAPDDPGQVLIKARGPEEEGLEFATARDVIRIDLDGKALDAPAGLTPPAETPLHTEIYRAQPTVNCVIHVHPVWVVALTAARRDLLPVFGAFDPTALRLVDRGIPVYESSVTVHTPEEGRAVAAAMQGAPVCVMRQHGIAVGTADIEEAVKLTLAINELARMNWLAAAVGEPTPISDEDLAIFRGRFAEAEARTKEPPRRRDGHSAYWHYLGRRLEEGGRTAGPSPEDVL